MNLYNYLSEFLSSWYTRKILKRCKNKKEKKGCKQKQRLKTGSDFSETRAIIHNFEKIKYKMNLGSSKCQKDHTKKHNNITVTLFILLSLFGLQTKKYYAHSLLNIMLTCCSDRSFNSSAIDMEAAVWRTFWPAITLPLIT